MIFQQHVQLTAVTCTFYQITVFLINSQSVFSCSKLTIETLEQGVNCVHS